MCIPTKQQTILPCVVRAQDYQLEVVLRSYRNPFNQRSSGHCCDPHTSYPVACNGQGCDSECDPYFAMNATYSTVNHTTSYIDTEQTDFPNSSVYMFYGESSLWLVSSHSLNQRPLWCLYIKLCLFICRIISSH